MPFLSPGLRSFLKRAAPAIIAGILVVCLGLGLSVQAQVYRFKSYTTSTGLPNNSVYVIFQDREGYLWFGTDQGICRYDGVNFQNYSLAEGLAGGPVRAITADRNGNLWIVTRGGVSCFDGAHFTNYGPAQGLPHLEGRSGLCARDGSLWFGMNSGLSRFDGKHFVNYGEAQGLPPWPVWTLLEDAQGTLWAGLRGGGLARFDGSRFTVYGRAAGLPSEEIFHLAINPAGGLWIATGSGVSRFDGQTFHNYGVAEGMSYESVSSVLVDRHGRVWCGTFGGGLNRLKDEIFTTFNRANGLPDNFVTALFEDREGNIWCGSRWGGACRLRGEMFANYPASTGIGDGVITGISRDPEGGIWFSSVNNGLSRLAPNGTVKHWGVADGLLEDSLWTVFVDQRGRVWTGGQRGVSCYDAGRFEQFPLTRLGTRSRIVAIIEDRQGNLWFGGDAASSTGIIRFDGKTCTTFSTAQGLAHNQVNGFVLDHAGRLWICTDQGLTRYDGERFTDCSTHLPNQSALCGFEDEQGRMWIGTYNGLCCFEGEGVRTYSTADGLIFNLVRTIKGFQGKLWIGTPQGISLFDGKQFHNYTVQDGLLSQDISRGGVSSTDGTIWLGTTEGAVRCRLPEELSQGVPPPVHVTAIRVEGATTALPGQSNLKVPLPSLASHENNLTFEYVGLSFTNEEGVKYRSFLQNFDRDWSPVTGLRSVRYTNLAPGHYVFSVKACSADGTWSRPEVVELIIRPPFWQTWWFRLMATGGVITLGAGLYLWRIRTIEALHRRRMTVLRQLLGSVQVINSQLDLATVLQNIAAESALLVKGEPGGIGLVEDGKVVFRRIWNSGAWENVCLEFPLGTGVAGKVAAQAASMIVNDTRNSPDIAFHHLLETYKIHGVMDVPIVTRTGKVVGVLDVRRRAGRKPFTEFDCQLIESLANQAAVAIENAHLYGEVGRKNDELEEKNLMITESLRELERLYQQEQEVSSTLQRLNQMKTNFLLVTSHEMRTPLTVIKGYTEALTAGFLGDLNPVQQQSLGSVRRMVERMVTTFNDILEMLKINEGKMQLRPTATDFPQVIQEVLEEMSTFSRQRGQTITVTGPETLLVTVDREKIHLVLLNLIQNAIKFTYDGGTIAIAVIPEEETVHITVQDSGIGIEATELNQIFELFYTTPDASTHTSGRFEFSARGTGLGLALVKHYVETHGGRIWAESEGLGKGSCFHIVLPKTTAVVGMESSALSSQSVKH
ncbi:MAG: GAF domain-containing protein [Blastocatellia bacterium]|nr:GAF domain-containing protein [Blastocatellia bacterium]